MSTREVGQSQASADALAAYEAKGQIATDARIEVRRLSRELNAARVALRIAVSEELDALRAYEATPYSDDNDEEVYGLCLACGSVEVRLLKATGVRDMSAIGESSEYPCGYGCAVCG